MGGDSFGGGCLFFVVCLVAVVFVAAIFILPDKVAEMENAEARRIEARAELASVRADAEHQRAVDGETRYMLHVATLAAFTGGSPMAMIANELCFSGLIGAFAIGCFGVLFWVFKQAGNGLQ